ncbi:MAG: phosphoglycerate kinase [Candidatus Stygibacter australis]|nr:phosphoglycerate kinase [Candidatus Stygibacter australis]MDP8321397.1 phosphoglycerate kinase [Candidatus Stygibacter australis]
MSKLKKIQDADLKGKIVLMRVDHNVVKKGKIIDPYRIDASLPTINYIIDQGAKLVLMSHVGRPKNKATGEIEISEKSSVIPIVEYLKAKGIRIKALDMATQGKYGIEYLDSEIVANAFKNDKLQAVYLPNTRWFKGEEAKDESREILGKELADIADIFVNDAFGSWQPHASTIIPAKLIPAYAGILMQKEVHHLDSVLNPQKPFVAVVAGSKFDTKIQPLSALLKRADYLMLGGVIYNAYLCVKYGVQIAGVSEEDQLAAHDFVELTSKYPGKIIEPRFIIESDSLEGKFEGKYRTIDINNLKEGKKLNYILDIDKASFQQDDIKTIFAKAGTFFVNAVMGFTPHFTDGTIALDLGIDANHQAVKLFGGGDTLQEFNTLLPEIYQQALQDELYYFFTGGGTILKAISEGSAWGLEPVKILKA